MAIRTPFFLSGPDALNMLGKDLLVQEGSADSLKWVSCIQRTSQRDVCAVFHKEDRFAGWLRPFTFRDKNFGIVACVVRKIKEWYYLQFVGVRPWASKEIYGTSGSSRSGNVVVYKDVRILDDLCSP